MFVTCLTWYIFERFGGTSVRATRLPQRSADNASTTGDPGGPTDSFCAPLTEREEPGYRVVQCYLEFDVSLSARLRLSRWKLINRCRK